MKWGHSPSFVCIMFWIVNVLCLEMFYCVASKPRKGCQRMQGHYFCVWISVSIFFCIGHYLDLYNAIFLLHRSNIVSKILTFWSQTLQTNANNCWFSQNMTLQFCKRKQKTNLQSTDSKQNFSVLLDISQKQKAFN